MAAESTSTIEVKSRSRRQMLAAALGGIGGFVLHAAGRPALASADTGDNAILGQANDAGTTTSLTSTASEATLLVANSTDTVPEADDETAVQGVAELSIASVGVKGQAVEGTGVWGTASNGAGVFGTGIFGVYGSGGFVGVTGDVDDGTGIQGWSGNDFPPAPTAQTGVWAGAERGRTALFVDGKMEMTKAGRTTFNAGTKTKTINVQGGVGVSAFAFAVLNSNRDGVYVRAVVPDPAGDKIKIYLNRTVTKSTRCAWMVLG
ncbi:MAG TPA: hypothetical protein VFK61_02200 [Candidatus Limnocylindria bacterium]|nr:hypothetical protein [Candidatus Limnocylindria bacterium]